MPQNGRTRPHLEGGEHHPRLYPTQEPALRWFCNVYVISIILSRSSVSLSLSLSLSLSESLSHPPIYTHTHAPPYTHKPSLLSLFQLLSALSGSCSLWT